MCVRQVCKGGCTDQITYVHTPREAWAAGNVRVLHMKRHLLLCKQSQGMCMCGRSVDYITLAVDVWLFMVLPTVYALTKSVLPISQGTQPWSLHPCSHRNFALGTTWLERDTCLVFGGWIPCCIVYSRRPNLMHNLGPQGARVTASAALCLKCFLKLALWLK